MKVKNPTPLFECISVEEQFSIIYYIYLVQKGLKAPNKNP
jgi:hypothetical protein